MDREELENRIEELKSDIDSFEKSDHVDESSYDDWLDEISGPVEIGSLTYCASTVLAQVDPIAYRCGFSDYTDSLELTDFDEYNDLVEELEELEDELENLEDEEE